jgi:DNA-binding MarR family transcriptional regulator
MRQQVDNVNQTSGTGDDNVLDLVHAVMHAFRARQYRAVRDGAAAGLTHMEGKVLGFFARHPGATQRELVEHSGRDKSQLTRLIAGLKERQLLDARADEADRRSVRLHLTPRGQALHRALHAKSRHLGLEAIAGLTDSERRQLVALLRRVQANIERAD